MGCGPSSSRSSASNAERICCYKLLIPPEKSLFLNITGPSRVQDRSASLSTTRRPNRSRISRRVISISSSRPSIPGTGSSTGKTTSVPCLSRSSRSSFRTRSRTSPSEPVRSALSGGHKRPCCTDHPSTPSAEGLRDVISRIREHHTKQQIGLLKPGYPLWGLFLYFKEISFKKRRCLNIHTT